MERNSLIAAMALSIVNGIFSPWVLAVFVGFEVINKVPPTLHTPLMSGSNAISGITVVGAILAAGSRQFSFATLLGVIAIALHEQAPTAMRAWPRSSRVHSPRRSRSDSPECRIATSSPNRARNRAASCGVSEISGTSTMAPWPRARAAPMRCR